MAEVTLDRLEYYSDQFSAIADEAENYFRDRANEVLQDVDFSDLDDDGKRDIRNQIIDIAKEVTDYFGGATASVGAMFYEEVLEDDGIFSRAKLLDGPSDEQVEKSVRYWAKNIFQSEPDPNKFLDGVSSFVKRVVGHSGDLTIMQSAEADEKLGIRFARVPQGPSCGWCIMLASRGFVYHSKEKAGEASRYHDDCDCRIIAGYEGLKVEGYDPDDMYDRYKKCRDAITHGDGGGGPVWTDWDRMSDKERSKYTDRHGNPSFNSYLEHRIVEEMNTRDRKWLYDGTMPKATFESEALMHEVIDKRKQELRTAARLRKHGINPDFVKDYEEVFNEEKGIYETKGLADWANGVEIKTLDEASTYNTINEYIKKTSKKRNAERLYFDNSRNQNMDDETLIKYILRSRAFKRGKIYVLGHDRNLRQIR